MTGLPKSGKAFPYKNAFGAWRRRESLEKINWTRVYLGGVAVAAVVAVLVAIYLPGFLDFRTKNKWRMACVETGNILKAESDYSQNHGGKYATLEQLAEGGLIDSDISKGQKYGYKFSLIVRGDGFEIHAVPANYRESSYASGRGARSFYGDEKGIVYGADKSGERATPNDANMKCPNDSSNERPMPW